MPTAEFRFYGPLNDFLPTVRRQRTTRYEFNGQPGIKDAIEALGVPHPEVAFIIVDGEACGFAHPLRDGQRAAVYPAADHLAPESAVRAAPPPPHPRRFVLDAHLRRLAVYLRLLGCDVRWWADADDAELAEVSRAEERILLTRDLGLLKRSVVIWGRFVRATDPVEQMVEIVTHFDLVPEAQPFTRCLRCNTPVVDVPKREVLDRLRPGTRRSFHRFRLCPRCDRVFWRGAHYNRLARLVRRALPAWEDPRAGEEETVNDDGHWWESFFSGLWLTVQRADALGTGAQAQTDFIERVLQLEPGAAVLDAPCGQGRIALALAARGYTVTGIDLCEEFLADARSDAEKHGLDVRIARHDMRDLPYVAEFDAVVCVWGSFGYFDDVGNMEQARAAARALRRGGQYLIDGHVAETMLPRMEPCAQADAAGLSVTEERTWNHETGRIDVEWTLRRGTETETKHSSMRMYTYRELTYLLESAGFTDFTAYDATTGEPFAVGARRLCIVATKSGS